MDLERFMISHRAARRWESLARAAVRAGAFAGLAPADVPDERAQPEEDGVLLIYVDLAHGRRVEMVVPPDEWAWRT